MLEYSDTINYHLKKYIWNWSEFC